ncbi:MAG: DNA polymerase III subunit delta' [Gammaproteobacteria bacterium HGW-Gammaproteobacteria-6]|nr:MAG: DNA polymerase III subunit delta' [Gammaproteobacteria bacterium HGW-Gammaproteobacteria-6]
MSERPCPWHDPLWQSLVAQPQHAHAYLFTGLPGIGKRRFANAFAAFMLCTQPHNAAACGQCRSCLLRLAGSHPDLLVIEPEEEGKGIKVDAIRQLVDFIGQTAQQGGRKLVLLHPAEAMNLNAANALLKSLEEPGRDTFLLLVSDQPSRLLATIRSRCRHQALTTPDAAQSLQWLTETLPDADAEARATLLQMAGGAPLRALVLHELDAVAMRNTVVEGVKALLKQQQSPAQLADAWSKLPLELLVDWFCSWTLDLFKLQTRATQVADNQDMDKVLGYMARSLNPGQLMNWQTWLLSHRALIQNRANLNRGLFTETLLIEWKKLLERR